MKQLEKGLRLLPERRGAGALQKGLEVLLCFVHLSLLGQQPAEPIMGLRHPGALSQSPSEIRLGAGEIPLQQAGRSASDVGFGEIGSEPEGLFEGLAGLLDSILLKESGAQQIIGPRLLRMPRQNRLGLGHGLAQAAALIQHGPQAQASGRVFRNPPQHLPIGLLGLRHPARHRIGVPQPDPGVKGFGMFPDEGLQHREGGR